MNMEDLKKGIGEIKSHGLKPIERQEILNQILGAPIPSPYGHFPKFLTGRWLAIISRRRFAYVLALILIIVLAGSTSIYAAENSLPGDIFYPIKVNLTEKIRDRLATTPKAKAEWATIKVGRRIQEATKLAAQGKLDETKSQEIEKLLTAHTESFNSVIEALATSTAAELHEISNAEIEFEAIITANKQVLKKVAEQVDKRQFEEIDSFKFPKRLKDTKDNHKDPENLDFENEREIIKIRIEKVKETIRQAEQEKTEKDNEILNNLKKEIIKNSREKIERAEKILDDIENAREKDSNKKVIESLHESSRTAAEADFATEAISKIKKVEQSEKLKDRNEN
ncbi:MAG TPA: DUF5667 domain-containing protein [Candidatus Paceibacterota bacterium]